MSLSAPEGTITAQCFVVRGTVQGVGFRPYVHQLAVGCGLFGDVANTPEGVCICVEGASEAVAAFRRRLPEEAPAICRITAMSVSSRTPRGLKTFTISTSRNGGCHGVQVPPDLPVCAHCLAEMADPANRRYRYPFINCARCGPRFTIIRQLPYDRPATAMRAFTMCDQCRAEYENPADRRFHAQPIACPACGPRLALRDGAGRTVPCRDFLAEAVARILKGGIVAVQGLGGFHLAVDARNEAAVAALRRRKHRPHKPFAVMVPDMTSAGHLVRFGKTGAGALLDPARPVVLLDKKGPGRLAPSVAPGTRRLGVMLPYTPLHHLLVQAAGVLVMTSGNGCGRPVVITEADALGQLAGVADAFLVHDRPIVQRCDDSVVSVTGRSIQVVRRSRGITPAPVNLGAAGPQVLAMGALLKNTICLTRNRRAFLSQHIGDLEDADTFAFYQETIAHLRRLLGIRPGRIACDLHPDYPSSRFARDLAGKAVVRVQHHHAHVAACMAEHRLAGPVIGLALDGTGYGTDGAVWGGEVLVATLAGFERAAHLAYVPMPGGDAAVRHPWRMAVSYLYRAFGASFSDLDLPMRTEIPRQQFDTVAGIASGRWRAPFTSSLGRLFDAVAAMAGGCITTSFEGQAAVMLEAAAGGALAAADQGYPWHVNCTDGGVYVADVSALIRRVASDAAQGVPVGMVSRRFHRAIVSLFTGLCLRVRKDTGIGKVVMSGGVFQNGLFLSGLRRSLAGEGFSVYTHRQVPCNDGGISLGQAVVAAAQR